MSSDSQTTTVLPSPAPPIVIFELNQARRAKVTRELEAVRSGSSSCEFLEWPTLEGLEAFVEKKTEYNEMMGDMISDVQAVILERLGIVQGLKRSSKLAEGSRLQEFQRALERMDPAEAEAARRAEREHALRLQMEYVARLAKLDAEWARIRARVREESPYDS